MVISLVRNDERNKVSDLGSSKGGGQKGGGGHYNSNSGVIN